MSSYVIYEHEFESDSPVAVKSGFCWPAFFFDWIWAFVKRLPIHGACLLAISATLTIADGYVHEGNSLAEVVGGVWLAYKVVVGAFGNRWREAALLDRGFDPVETVEADSPEQALAGGAGISLSR